MMLPITKLLWPLLDIIIYLSADVDTVLCTETASVRTAFVNQLKLRNSYEQRRKSQVRDLGRT